MNTLDHAELRALVLEHADMIGRANCAELAAARLNAMGEIERSEIERDEAREQRFRADCLAKLLGPHGVYVPDPRQLSLLADGGMP